MKNVFLALLLLVSITTLAQDKKERRPEREKLTKEQKVDLQVKKMTKDLALNEKQSQEVRAIVTKEVEKREAKRAELKELKEKKREEIQTKIKEERAILSAEMKKILTAEQFTKWEKSRDEKKAKMKEKMGDRRGNPDFKQIEEDK